MIILSAFFFACMNVSVRLAGDLPSVEKSFFRNLVAAVFAAVILCKNRTVPKVDKKYWGPLILRCVCGTLGILCNFYAIDHLLVVVEHNLLDLHLLLVGELKALRAKNLDTVKLVWIVGGGKHDGGIRVGVCHQVSDRRSRHGAQRHHVRTDRTKSRRDGAFQHVVRDAGVVSDHLSRRRRHSFVHPLL